MNKLLGFFLAVLTIAASFTATECGASDLIKLLESRDYWATYMWDNFEDSQLYKLTTWKLRGGSGVGNTKITDNYTTPIWINNLNVRELNMRVNVKTKEVADYSIYSFNLATTDDYNRFVDWCVERFGDIRVENKRSETSGEYVSNTISSTWTVGNTIVTVRTENNLSNGPKSVGFITTLSFTKGYRPTVTIANEIQPTSSGQQWAGGGTSQAVQATTGPNSSPPPPAFPVAVSSRPISATSNAAVVRPVTPVMDDRYLSPPYIWEDEQGTTQATNDILSVPEDRRAAFEKR